MLLFSLHIENIDVQAQTMRITPSKKTKSLLAYGTAEYLLNGAHLYSENCS